MTRSLLAVIRPVAIAVLFALMGGPMVYVGVRQATVGSTLDDRGRRAVGTVLDTREKRTSTGKTAGHRTELHVEFTTADGARRTFWDGGEAAVGDTVDITYDPENPETVIIGTPASSMSVGGIGLAATGGILLLAALAATPFYLRRSLRAARTAAPPRHAR
ncbi:hypothetical protein BJF79_26735 [Actinomadura sp. CNU-125]|uniref:DUF3592 domain-containing protein n=1 Tax=Actinomadura sp. CNU-125 TaxID=1904961 RepID=UPI00096A1E19|nr:DUF3592 domain-containing protein [Actinomadura sp. CNU-125]OLT38439.1 hypothetical protein BJF79_26735 [Actinomadura sp. CNU-125]